MNPDIVLTLIQISRQFGDLPAEAVAATLLGVLRRVPGMQAHDLHTEAARQLHRARQHVISAADWDWDDEDAVPWNQAVDAAHRQAEADFAAALISAALRIDGRLSQADIDRTLDL
jgi:hypothetical protein